MKDKLLKKASKQLYKEYRKPFMEWVSNNCEKITDSVYKHNGVAYIYTKLPTLYTQDEK